jgi:phage gp46-like protein
MATDEPDPFQSVSDRLSDLHVGLEDLVNDDSMETLLKVLALFRDLRHGQGTRGTTWSGDRLRGAMAPTILPE